MLHGDSAWSLLESISTPMPATKYHAAPSATPRGSGVNRCEDSEADQDLPEPRNHPERFRREAHEDQGQRHARHA